MKNGDGNNPPKHDESFWSDARVLEESVRAIRKAQGKKNPEDVQFGTPEWEALSCEFMDDLCATIDQLAEAARREDDGPHGVGAAG